MGLGLGTGDSDETRRASHEQPHFTSTSTSLDFTSPLTSPLPSPPPPRQRLPQHSPLPPLLRLVSALRPQNTPQQRHLHICSRQWCTTSADSSPRLDPVPVPSIPSDPIIRRLPLRPLASHTPTAYRYNLPFRPLSQACRKISWTFRKTQYIRCFDYISGRLSEYHPRRILHEVSSTHRDNSATSADQVWKRNINSLHCIELDQKWISKSASSTFVSRPPTYLFTNR